MPIAPRGVLCAGNLVYDILVRPVDRLLHGSTTWVEEIATSMGGNGANTAYDLAKLGVRVRVLGSVGRDGFGDTVLARLASGGVDTSRVGRSGKGTATSVSLVSTTGERALLHRTGASVDAFPPTLDFAGHLRDGFDHFHLGNIFALPSLRMLGREVLGQARSAGLTTSFDTGWDARGEWLTVIGPCLPQIDLLFVNEDEARMLTGIASAEPAARELQRLGARTVVVHLGERGCVVFDGAAAGLASCGFAVDVVDTTGAGDAFAAGFLAALSRGASLRDAARLANAVGALSVETLGATDSVRSYEETLAWLASDDGEKFT